MLKLVYESKLKDKLQNNFHFKLFCNLSLSLHPKDLAYKKLLQKGLQDSFGISCKPEDLNAVAEPFELKQILTN